MGDNMSNRSDQSQQLFKSGYNCCQSVMGAFKDVVGIDEKTLMKLYDGFGGGMARMRLTCGAVSAIASIVGMLYSNGNMGDLQNRYEVYKKVQEAVGVFKEKHGSVICGEILSGVITGGDGPRPEERTKEYYQKRPCLGCINDATLIIETFLNDKNN